jgi:hypothetical protein
MKIRLDGKYKMKDGTPIERVLAVDLGGNYPVAATHVITNKGERYEVISTYTKEGEYYLLTPGGSADLVEIKTETYVKSMKQILEEFPESKFGLGGILTIVKDSEEFASINAGWFEALGKLAGGTIELWEEYLLEEREVEDA